LLFIGHAAAINGETEKPVPALACGPLAVDLRRWLNEGDGSHAAANDDGDAKPAGTGKPNRRRRRSRSLWHVAPVIVAAAG
jgi:hypothetical protein